MDIVGCDGPQGVGNGVDQFLSCAAPLPPQMSMMNWSLSFIAINSSVSRFRSSILPCQVVPVVHIAVVRRPRWIQSLPCMWPSVVDCTLLIP